MKKDKKASKDYYYLYNGHGDVVQIVDTSGAVINNYTYDEWGNITSQVEGTSNSFKYSGEVYDAETGLYYLRARYYDPSMGRFLNEDTYEGQIDNPLTQNLYTYVINNPLIYTDPTGHMHAWGAGWSGFAENRYSATDPWKGWSGPVGWALNFLIIDSINTLRDPNASRLDIALAVMGIIPLGKVESIAGKLFVNIMKEGKLISATVDASIEWKSYLKHDVTSIKGYKKLTWSEIRATTKQGAAMYKPDINIESLERYAWEYGVSTTNGKTWKVMQLCHWSICWERYCIYEG
ncbi:RHS repeat-associated core domain-containing protein [Paenibacillus riograndensis]|uniref:RHS repeat-associated core domain-containing protein n=1 Tax=Paenibacillus riograndensis TaxID=483937 RepID=UPI000A632676|nr:RHS repeat-associated core domain-containing protein [Paenibacillus riograndensis]